MFCGGQRVWRGEGGDPLTEGANPTLQATEPISAAKGHEQTCHLERSPFGVGINEDEMSAEEALGVAAAGDKGRLKAGRGRRGQIFADGRKSNFGW